MPSAVYLHDGEHQITVTFRTEQDKERFKAHYRTLDALAVQYRDERDALAARLATLTAAGIVVGEDGAVRWHGLARAKARELRDDLAFWQEEGHAARKWLGRLMERGCVPEEWRQYVSQFADAPDDADAAAAGRGADGEAGE